MTTSEPDGVVKFRFYRPDVEQVLLLGTFNGWTGDSLQMSDMGDGWWSLEIELPEGEYRFRYLADGKWFTDYAANGIENGKHGWNSVLIVPEYKRTMMRRDEMERKRLTLNSQTNKEMNIAA